jgi:enoyl-CoA hydratase/carnithine racemase
LLLFDQILNASEALRLGLIDEVVTVDLLWVRSLEVARLAAQGARESHQMTKRMLNESIGEELFTLLNIAAADMATARTSDVAKEGIAAFFGKRLPKWDSQ